MADSIAKSLVKMVEMEGKGRSLIATRAIKAGEVILRDSPVILYPASNQSCKFCSHCFKKIQSRSVFSCPSCSDHGAILFCTLKCQTTALATSHSPWVCETLKYIRSSSFSIYPDIQSQLNFLVAAYNLASINVSNFNLLMQLQGDTTTPVNPEILALHSIISSKLPQNSFPVEVTAALLAKDKRNAFGLMEEFQGNEEREVRAYGIYLMASFFNHDCLPNACRFDYVDGTSERNTDIIMRALHDISEGSEICISYFPVNWNYVDRQKRLLEDYGFVCECDRCRVESNWKISDANDVENMEEEEDERMNGSEENDDDFPHAYFFLRYLCDKNYCGGTLAPLPPEESDTPLSMECNVCGQLKWEQLEESSEEELEESSEDMSD